MRIDCRKPGWGYDPNLAVIDADTGFMIEQVVAVDDEEGWVVVNVCDRSGWVLVDRKWDMIRQVKLHRPVRVIDLRTVPKDQRHGTINLMKEY